MSTVMPLFRTTGDLMELDTRLEHMSPAPGDVLRGTVHVAGGAFPQHVDAITLYVTTSYMRRAQNHIHTERSILVGYRVCEPFTLYPDEERALPFAFRLPQQTPLSLGYHPVYLHTSLGLASAFDPSDVDILYVQPHPTMRCALDALGCLGFVLEAAPCRYERRHGLPYPFVQEALFQPTTMFTDEIQRLDVSFALRDEWLEVVVTPHPHGWRQFRRLSGAGTARSTVLHCRHDEASVGKLVDQIDEAVRAVLTSQSRTENKHWKP